MVRSSLTPPHPPQHRIHLCRRVTPRSMSPIIVNMGGERRGEKSRVQGNNAITCPRLEVSTFHWDLKPDTQTTTLPRFHSERPNKIELMIPFHEPFWYEKFHQRFPRAFNCSHERRPSIDGLCVDFCSAFKQQLNKIYLPRVTRMMQWTPLEIIFGVDVRAGR